MAGQPTPKMWYQSSTVWINLAGVGVILLQVLSGTDFGLDPDVQAIILAVVNILNRFRTQKPIERKVL